MRWSHAAAPARALPGVLAVALATGCASTALPLPDRVVEVATGRELTRADLLAEMRRSDFVLLGELHDNPHHHARRGELIADLGGGAAVVAEHLERGRRVDFGRDLAQSLGAAGFDAKGWQWPIHEPLFGAIARTGVPLTGGNAPRDLVRLVARQGEAAVPGELRPLLDAAPLGLRARAALEADLVQGHCGHLAGPRLQAMLAAQRVRDAWMGLALQDAAQAGGRPAILLAGNGHVRTDYGVPQLIKALRPQARLLSIGFGEPGDTATGAPYTHLWITPRARRDDPCATMPRL